MDRLRRLAIRLLENLHHYPYDEEDVYIVMGHLTEAIIMNENNNDPYSEFFDELYEEE